MEKFKIFAGQPINGEIPFITTKEFENEKMAMHYAKIMAAMSFVKTYQEKQKQMRNGNSVNFAKFLLFDKQNLKTLKEEFEKEQKYKVEKVE